MAESLQAFFKENALPVEHVRFVASKRFQADGKPVEWEICAISAREDEKLRAQCMKEVVEFAGKRRQRRVELDVNAYGVALCARCTVYPNLNDGALQDSYGVKGAEALLSAMLLASEFYDYYAEVQKVNGFDVSMDDLVDEAKN